jgi:hypothetical protein
MESGESPKSRPVRHHFPPCVQRPSSGDYFSQGRGWGRLLLRADR